MSTGFWLKRFALAFLVGAALLFVVQYLKGMPPADALKFGALWGAISAAIFTLTGYVRYRRNPACMLPRSGRE